jgi:hypothetical protein
MFLNCNIFELHQKEGTSHCVLTFQSIVVTVRTTSFNVKNLHIFLTEHIYSVWMIFR